MNKTSIKPFNKRLFLLMLMMQSDCFCFPAEHHQGNIVLFSGKRKEKKNVNQLSTPIVDYYIFFFSFFFFVPFQLKKTENIEKQLREIFLLSFFLRSRLNPTSQQL